jgi:Domain of unknown function (DUF4382)/Domain of unknown function (DUF5666)
MLRKLQTNFYLFSLITLSLSAMLGIGCAGSGNSTTSTPSGETGAAFVVGTDAPVAGVVSFAVQLNTITATNASNNQVSLLSGAPTVDFARFNGLQTLIDLNDVPVGTYSNITITLGSGTIGYLNTNPGSAPTIATEPATFTQSTIQVPLSSPLVVSQTGPVGLHLDFDLYKSLQVTNGQITGQVTPTFNINVVTPSSSGAYIDEFDAAVVSVDASAESFQIDGPHGRQFTVNVNGQTEFDNGENLGDLTTSSIIEISGTLDRADSTIDADEVAILSQNGFYAAGQVTYVQPSSGPATDFDLYVRGLLPTTTGLTLGDIAQVDLTGNENYFIYWMHNPLTQFLFNSSSLLPGQHVSIGGPASGATNPQAVTTKRVVLRHWGFNGQVVPGSANTGNDTFQMNVTGFAGLLVPGTVTVYAGDAVFRNGLNNVTDASNAASIRVVGLLIKDPTSGQPVIIAHYVDLLN